MESEGWLPGLNESVYADARPPQFQRHVSSQVPSWPEPWYLHLEVRDSTPHNRGVGVMIQWPDTGQILECLCNPLLQMGSCTRPSQKELMIPSIPHRGHCSPHFQTKGLEGPGARLTRKASWLEPGASEGPHLWLQMLTPGSGRDSGSSLSRDDQHSRSRSPPR